MTRVSQTSHNTTGFTTHAQNSAWENQRVPTAWRVRCPKGAVSQHGTHVNSINTEMNNRRVLRPEATTPPAGELLGGHPRGVHHGLASLKPTEPGRPAHHTRGTRGREFESKESNQLVVRVNSPNVTQARIMEVNEFDFSTTERASFSLTWRSGTGGDAGELVRMA